ncbi:MAG: ATP synthase F1 subunit epsilon [Patescibacteria group bacterium]
MTLTLKIITQEKELLRQEVESVTIPTVDGEITVLANHVPLFTRIKVGEVIFRNDGEEHSVVVADGFTDVSPDNVVTIMTDTAVRSSDIDILKAEEAKKRAEEQMQHKLDQRDFVLAEASLRKAMMEIQSYNKRKNIS